MRKFAAVFAGFFALALGGCTVGRELPPLTQVHIEAGTTTEADIRRQLGEPMSIKRYTTQKGESGGGNVEGSPFDSAQVEGDYVEMIYVFGDKEGLALTTNGGLVRRRMVNAVLWNGVVIDYCLLSNYAEDTSKFDGARLPDIRKGDTIEAQVRSLLGQPCGVGIYPAVRDPGSRVLHYGYASLTVGLMRWDRDMQGQSADVLVDSRGRVLDYRYSTSSQ